MELAPSTEPWTAAVAWARPWRRPAPRRQAAAAPRAARPPAAAVPEIFPSDPIKDAAWVAAVAELQAAQQCLASVESGLESGLDTWLEALARQDLFRARRQLRRAQEALTGTDADLPWSSC